MNLCILSIGTSNVWIVVTSLISFSTILIMSGISLITKATEKNKKPKSKKIILLSILYAFLFSFLVYALSTRTLFAYELERVDYMQLKEYLKHYQERDVFISKMGTNILLCKRPTLNTEMLSMLNDIKDSQYMTYEDLICFSKLSCE